MTWLELAKKYFIFDERFPGKRVSIERVAQLTERDEDYFLCMQSRKEGSEGEVYRYSNDGSMWGVYIKASNTKRRRKRYWNRFAKLGFEITQVGDDEGAWKFDAKYLTKVVRMLGVHRAGIRKKPEALTKAERSGGEKGRGIQAAMRQEKKEIHEQN